MHCQGHAVEPTLALWRPLAWAEDREFFTDFYFLQTFIEGDPAHHGVGELPGQQLLPGEETPGGRTVPPHLPAKPQPGWHTEPCPG